MANYQNLLNQIASVITANGNNEITGTILKNTLQSMVSVMGANATYGGVAHPTDNPGTPDGPVVYIASTAGIYTNFGAISLEQNELAVLLWNASAGTWSKESIVYIADIDEVTNALNYALVDINTAKETAIEQIEESGAVIDSTYNKTLVEPKNKINPAELEANKYIDKTNGRAYGAGGFTATGYIAVSDDMYCGKRYVGGAAIGGAVYDADKSYLRALTTLQYTYEDGDAFIRYTILNENVSTAQCEEGTSATAYEPYFTPYYIYSLKPEMITDGSVDITKLSFTDTYKGINLADPSEFVSGKAISYSDGAEFTLSDYGHTGFIPLNGRNIYLKSMATYGTAGAAFYDADKRYTHGSTAANNIYQSGDAFVRFTFLLSNTEIMAYYIGNTAIVLPYVPYNSDTIVDPVKLKIPLTSIEFTVEQTTTKNKFNKNNVCLNYLMAYSDSTISKNPDTFITDLIPITSQGLATNGQMDYGITGSMVLDKNLEKIRMVNTSPIVYQEGDAYVQFCFPVSQIDTIQVEDGAVSTSYEAYSGHTVLSPDVIPSGIVKTNDVKSALASLGINTDNINIYLPDNIYAVVGDTIQLFFQQMVKAVDISNYNILCSCSQGNQYRRYYELTPSTAGNIPLTIKIKDNNGNILGTASTTIIVSAQPQSPSTNVNVVCVGDSMTANGVWVHEADRRLTGTDGTPAGLSLNNINFVGSMNASGSGFIGNAGWAWSDYASSGRSAYRFSINSSANVTIGAIYTVNSFRYEIVEINIINSVKTILCQTSSSSNTPPSSGTLTKVSGSGDTSVAYTSATADSANPFWDGTKVTFVNYVNNHCNGEIDIMCIILGANGLTAWKSDYTNFRNYMTTFFDALHSEFPNCKVLLMSVPIPSMKLMMPGYGADGSGYADTYGIVNSLQNLRNFYQEFANDENYSSFISFVDVASQLDSDYNYPRTEKDVNTRNDTVTEPYASNTIHPANIGYLQIADAVYRSLCNIL